MAQIIIDVPDEQVPRIQAAWLQATGEAANIATVKAWMIDQLKTFVLRQERLAAVATAEAGVTPIDAT